MNQKQFNELLKITKTFNFYDLNDDNIHYRFTKEWVNLNQCKYFDGLDNFDFERLKKDYYDYCKKYEGRLNW